MRISDQVVEKLKALIIEQQLEVGMKLPAERQLAEQLGTSRPSLREAIQQLNSLGVLKSRRGDGTYVDVLPQNWSQQHIIEPIHELLQHDPDYRFDVQESRLILEGGCAWYAAQRATTEDCAKIRHCFEQISYYQNRADSAQAAIADAQFHLAIAEASHNVVLIQMMRSLFDLLHYNVYLGRKKVYEHSTHASLLSDQHAAVLDAIERRDAQAAKDAMCGHIDFVIGVVRTLDDDDARIKRVARLKKKDTEL